MATNNPIATWKKIDATGTGGKYSVSNLGEVRNDLTGNPMRSFPLPSGYRTIILSHQGTKTHHYVHALVAVAFIGPRPDGYTVNHLNGIKSDNRVENLEWCSQSDNNAHAFRVLGRRPARGSQIWQTKMTDWKVRLMRDLVRRGMPQTTAATCFRLSKPTVSKIMTGRLWRHIH